MRSTYIIVTQKGESFTCTGRDTLFSICWAFQHARSIQWFYVFEAPRGIITAKDMYFSPMSKWITPSVPFEDRPKPQPIPESEFYAPPIEGPTHNPVTPPE